MKQLQPFLDYLHHERGLSPLTRAAYKRDLLLLAEELQRLEIEQPGNLKNTTSAASSPGCIARAWAPAVCKDYYPPFAAYIAG